LQPGEAAQVGRAIAAVLMARRNATSAEPQPVPRVDVSGEWEVRVSFLHGARTHRLRLRQDGDALTGDQMSEQFAGKVVGRLTAGGVCLTLTDRYEGSTISYRLDGDIADQRMSGTVVLGSASDHHQGPVNLAQFGPGEWLALRRASVRH
jgi:hypothetical protein